MCLIFSCFKPSTSYDSELKLLDSAVKMGVIQPSIGLYDVDIKGDIHQQYDLGCPKICNLLNLASVYGHFFTEIMIKHGMSGKRKPCSAPYARNSDTENAVNI